VQAQNHIEAFTSSAAFLHNQDPEETPMKSIATAITAISVALLAAGVSAEAATKGKNAATAQREASCKAQAAKKYSAIRFMARRDYVDKCMGRAAMAKGKKAKKARSAQRS
jgi:hypothetical protein